MTDSGAFFMSCGFAEQDLAHIGNVIKHFEHRVRDAGPVDAGAVFGLDYWRARIQAILATPQLPFHIDRQAKDLLRRLNLLDVLPPERCRVM
jgi:hypothetical protein